MNDEDHLVQPRLSRGLLVGGMPPDGELTWPDKERYLALLRFCLELRYESSTLILCKELSSTIFAL